MRERKEPIDRLLAEALDRPSPIPRGMHARFAQNTEIKAQLTALVDLMLQVTGAPQTRSLIEALLAPPPRT
jgi:hypothetical protein